ncbi:MAG TPA: hypothetical protein VMZ52_08820 [Bryobacteraceae bacterium]|nr:hypothetical protein [Bryobacteraceae bacterium]
MSKASTWIPMRWPSGPLETALQPGNKSVNELWHKPESLNFLKGSPVNCIVVTWSADKPEVSSQQETLQPLIAHARQMGLGVIGRCSGSSRAPSAGLDALLVEGPSTSAQEISCAPAARLRAYPADVVAVDKAVWPKIPARATSGAGPTGSPWVDSNGWMLLLAGAKAPGKILWTLAEPAADSPAIRPESYLLAIADSAAYGAQWVVALDPRLRGGLAGNAPDALSCWKTMTESLRFFAAHQEWRSYTQQSRLGVLSDFAGPNEYIGSEVLNLCNRRHLPYRVLDMDHLTAGSFDKLAAMLLVSARPPEGALRQQIDSYVKSGGVLIAPASAAPMVAAGAPAGNFESRYDYFPAGKGKIAIARKPWTDPYVLATDVHLILSRRHDVVRLWNAGVTNVRYTVSSQGKGLLQLVNYAMRPFGHPMSAYVAHPFGSARFVSLPGGESMRLDVVKRDGGIEIAIPPFAVFGAVELGV